eukprot:g10154.t1
MAGCLVHFQSAHSERWLASTSSSLQNFAKPATIGSTHSSKHGSRAHSRSGTPRGGGGARMSRPHQHLRLANGNVQVERAGFERQIELEASSECRISDAFSVEVVSDALVSDFYFVASRKIPLIDLQDCLQNQQWGVFEQPEIVRLVCGVLSDLGRFCVKSEMRDIEVMRGIPIGNHQQLLKDQEVLNLLMEILQEAADIFYDFSEPNKDAPPFDFPSQQAGTSGRAVPPNDLLEGQFVQDKGSEQKSKSQGGEEGEEEEEEEDDGGKKREKTLWHREKKHDLNDEEELRYEGLLSITARAYSVLRLAIWGNPDIATYVAHRYLRQLHEHVCLPEDVARHAMVLLKYVYSDNSEMIAKVGEPQLKMYISLLRTNKRYVLPDFLAVFCKLGLHGLEKNQQYMLTQFEHLPQPYFPTMRLVKGDIQLRIPPKGSHTEDTWVKLTTWFNDTPGSMNYEDSVFFRQNFWFMRALTLSGGSNVIASLRKGMSFECLFTIVTSPSLPNNLKRNVLEVMMNLYITPTSSDRGWDENNGQAMTKVKLIRADPREDRNLEISSKKNRTNESSRSLAPPTPPQKNTQIGNLTVDPDTDPEDLFERQAQSEIQDKLKKFVQSILRKKNLLSPREYNPEITQYQHEHWSLVFATSVLTMLNRMLAAEFYSREELPELIGLLFTVLEESRPTHVAAVRKSERNQYIVLGKTKILAALDQMMTIAVDEALDKIISLLREDLEFGQDSTSLEALLTHFHHDLGLSGLLGYHSNVDASGNGTAVPTSLDSSSKNINRFMPPPTPKADHRRTGAGLGLQSDTSRTTDDGASESFYNLGRELTSMATLPTWDPFLDEGGNVPKSPMALSRMKSMAKKKTKRMPMPRFPAAAEPLANAVEERMRSLLLELLIYDNFQLQSLAAKLLMRVYHHFDELATHLDQSVILYGPNEHSLHRLLVSLLEQMRTLLPSFRQARKLGALKRVMEKLASLCVVEEGGEDETVNSLVQDLLRNAGLPDLMLQLMGYSEDALEAESDPARQTDILDSNGASPPLPPLRISTRENMAGSDLDDDDDDDDGKESSKSNGGKLTVDIEAAKDTSKVQDVLDSAFRMLFYFIFGNTRNAARISGQSEFLPSLLASLTTAPFAAHALLQLLRHHPPAADLFSLDDLEVIVDSFDTTRRQVFLLVMQVLIRPKPDHPPARRVQNHIFTSLVRGTTDIQQILKGLEASHFSHASADLEGKAKLAATAEGKKKALTIPGLQQGASPEMNLLQLRSTRAHKRSPSMAVVAEEKQSMSGMAELMKILAYCAQGRNRMVEAKCQQLIPVTRVIGLLGPVRPALVAEPAVDGISPLFGGPAHGSLLAHASKPDRRVSSNLAENQGHAAGEKKIMPAGRHARGRSNGGKMGGSFLLSPGGAGPGASGLLRLSKRMSANTPMTFSPAKKMPFEVKQAVLFFFHEVYVYTGQEGDKEEVSMEITLVRGICEIIEGCVADLEVLVKYKPVTDEELLNAEEDEMEQFYQERIHLPRYVFDFIIPFLEDVFKKLNRRDDLPPAVETTLESQAIRACTHMATLAENRDNLKPIISVESWDGKVHARNRARALMECLKVCANFPEPQRGDILAKVGQYTRSLQGLVAEIEREEKEAVRIAEANAQAILNASVGRSRGNTRTAKNAMNAMLEGSSAKLALPEPQNNGQDAMNVLKKNRAGYRLSTRSGGGQVGMRMSVAPPDVRPIVPKKSLFKALQVREERSFSALTDAIRDLLQHGLRIYTPKDDPTEDDHGKLSSLIISRPISSTDMSSDIPQISEVNSPGTTDSPGLEKAGTTGSGPLGGGAVHQKTPPGSFCWRFFSCGCLRGKQHEEGALQVEDEDVDIAQAFTSSEADSPDEEILEVATLGAIGEAHNERDSRGSPHGEGKRFSSMLTIQRRESNKQVEKRKSKAEAKRTSKLMLLESENSSGGGALKSPTLKRKTRIGDNFRKSMFGSKERKSAESLKKQKKKGKEKAVRKKNKNTSMQQRDFFAVQEQRRLLLEQLASFLSQDQEQEQNTAEGDLGTHQDVRVRFLKLLSHLLNQASHDKKNPERLVDLQRTLTTLTAGKLVMSITLKGKPEMVKQALLFGTLLLRGGSRPVQESLLEQLSTGAGRKFLEVLRSQLRGQEETAHWTLLYDRDDVAIASLIILFLQLACEGNNLEMQTFLHHQNTHLDMPVNLVAETANLLLVFSQELIELMESNASDKAWGSDVQEKDSSSSSALLDLGITIFRALTTFCRGPCRINQNLLAKSALGPSLTLLRSLQNMKEINARERDDLEVKEQHQANLPLLERSILEFLLSLVEGANAEGTLRLLEGMDVDVLFRALEQNWTSRFQRDHQSLSYARVEQQIEEEAADAFQHEKAAHDSMRLRQEKKKRAKDEAWQTTHMRPSDEFVLVYTLLAMLSASTTKASSKAASGAAAVIARRFNRWKQGTANNKDVLIRHIARVEVVQDGKLHEIYFKIPLAFAKHRGAHELMQAQLELLFTASRNSPEDKLTDFLKGIEHLVAVCEHEEMLAGLTRVRWLLSTARGYPWWQWAYIVAVLINCLVVSFAWYDEPLVGVVPIPMSWKFGYSLQIIRALGVVHLVFSLFMMVDWVAGRGHMQYEATVKRLKNKARLKAAAQAAGPMAASGGGDMEAVAQQESVIMNTNMRVKAVLLMLRDPIPLYYLVWLCADILGIFGFVMFYAVHLIDAVVHNRTLRYVLSAVTKRPGQMAATGFLGFIVLYLYAVVGFSLFPDQYNFSDDLDKIYNCTTMWGCLQRHLDVGFRSAPVWHMERTLLPVVYDLAFFFFIQIALVGLVTAVIIDTFSEMRTEKDRIEEDVKNTCFLCCIDREIFEFHGKSFNQHMFEDHYMWNFAYLRKYLKDKDPTDLTGPEVYLHSMFEARNIGFFPLKRAMFLERLGVNSYDVKATKGPKKGTSDDGSRDKTGRVVQSESRAGKPATSRHTGPPSAVTSPRTDKHVSFAPGGPAKIAPASGVAGKPDDLTAMVASLTATVSELAQTVKTLEKRLDQQASSS